MPTRSCRASTERRARSDGRIGGVKRTAAHGVGQRVRYVRERCEIGDTRPVALSRSDIHRPHDGHGSPFRWRQSGHANRSRSHRVHGASRSCDDCGMWWKLVGADTNRAPSRGYVRYGGHDSAERLHGHHGVAIQHDGDAHARRDDADADACRKRLYGHRTAQRDVFHDAEGGRRRERNAHVDDRRNVHHDGHGRYGDV